VVIVTGIGQEVSLKKTFKCPFPARLENSKL